MGHNLLNKCTHLRRASTWVIWRISIADGPADLMHRTHLACSVLGSGTFMIRHFRARKTIQGETSYIFLPRRTLSVNGSPLRGNWLPLCFLDGAVFDLKFEVFNENYEIFSWLITTFSQTLLRHSEQFKRKFLNRKCQAITTVTNCKGVDRTIVRNDLNWKLGKGAWQRQWLAAKADEIQHLHCYVGVLSTHKRVFFPLHFHPTHLPSFRWVRERWFGGAPESWAASNGSGGSGGRLADEKSLVCAFNGCDRKRCQKQKSLLQVVYLLRSRVGI